jgi:uncharacterized protein involved in exopolysaccharide biosynthesis
MSSVDVMNALIQDWKEMYSKSLARANELRADILDRDLRIIRLESQRRTLLASLRQTAALLEADSLVRARMFTVAKQLEDEYEDDSARSAREAAGDPKPDTGFTLTHRPTQVVAEDGTTAPSPF